ncbi:hypothetical protein HK096_009453, partial [Nowakowskiella sp. JEL0078]
MTQEISEFEWILIRENKNLPSDASDINSKAPNSQPPIPLIPPTPDQQGWLFAQLPKMLLFLLWALLVYFIFFGRGSKLLKAFDQPVYYHPPILDKMHLAMVPEIAAVQHVTGNQVVVYDVCQWESHDLPGEIVKGYKDEVMAQHLDIDAALNRYPFEFFVRVGMVASVVRNVLVQLILKQIEAFVHYYHWI